MPTRCSVPRSGSIAARIHMVVAASGQPNIQRERQIADGTTQITITTAEASQIADTVDGAIGAGNGDLDVVSRELVASLHYAPGTEVAGAIAEQIGEVPAGNARGAVTMRPEAGKEVSSTFTLTEKKMVNLWMEGQLSYYGALPANYSLILSGTTVDGYAVGPYESKKSPGSAESVSLALPAGTYTITVRDDSTFASLPYTASVEYEMKPFRSQKIEGMVSIENREVAMPVSMSVAEFDPNTGLRLPLAKNGLQPDKPVWVVVHGRVDNPESHNMKELQRRLFDLAGENYQVVFVDWEEAANDVARILGKDIGDLENAAWTPAVGKWIGQQLLAAGISATNARFLGHSHGTFASYFAAEWMQQEWKKLHPNESGKAGAIIALDSAKNPVFLGADIPEERIVFSNVAEHSLAFHSSILGSRNRAFGADRAVTVTSSHIDPFKEHGFAVSMFADMLADMKTGKNHRITPFFCLSNEDGVSLNGLPDAEGYDAWIDVRTELVDTSDGPQWQAQASALRFKNTDGSWSTPLLDPEVENYSQAQPPSSGPGSYLP